MPPPLVICDSSSYSPTISSSRDRDIDSLPSPCSSDSSFDDDDVNRRVKPYWPRYRSLFKSRGYQLDTVRDVRDFYHQLEKTSGIFSTNSLSYALHGQKGSLNDDELCPDAGLPDNLFRGTRICDDKKFVAKAVHACSREYDVIQLLSRSPLKDDPMNHSIPVLEFFECIEDHIAFIIMEEWSSQLIPDSGPCCLKLYLSALRQCIEHAAFMHKHHIAHLDISLRNLLTDYEGRYAYIDYELSRNFEGDPCPRVYGYRGTEVPPECEVTAYNDPFKIDVWALAVVVLRACKMSGYHVPELMQLIRPMLHEQPERRPSLQYVLKAFDEMLFRMGDRRLKFLCPLDH